MAQEYRPEIMDGDRRVLILHGKPVSHVLARIPSQGETRGNLAAGGRGVIKPISKQERKIADTIGAFFISVGFYLSVLMLLEDISQRSTLPVNMRSRN